MKIMFGCLSFTGLISSALISLLKKERAPVDAAKVPTLFRKVRRFIIFIILIYIQLFYFLLRCRLTFSLDFR